jgi:hypothetical protein
MTYMVWRAQEARSIHVLGLFVEGPRRFRISEGAEGAQPALRTSAVGIACALCRQRPVWMASHWGDLPLSEHRGSALTFTPHAEKSKLFARAAQI